MLNGFVLELIIYKKHRSISSDKLSFAHSQLPTTASSGPGLTHLQKLRLMRPKLILCDAAWVDAFVKALPDEALV